MKNLKKLLLLFILLVVTSGCGIFSYNSKVVDTTVKVTASQYGPLESTTDISIKIPQLNSVNKTYTTEISTSSDVLMENNPLKSVSLIRGIGPLVKLAKSNPQSVFVHGLKSEKTVALTFDDGPDNDLTPKLLDVLKNHGVKASFFVIGHRTDNAIPVLQRANSEGHLILNHTYSHTDLRKLDEDTIKKELIGAEDKIYSAIGKRTAIIRPPFGSTDQRVVNVINKLGYKTLLWSIDTLDWQHMDKQKTIDSVINSIKTEDVVLMHMNENKNATLEAVPEIIESLKFKGYRFVTVDEMFDIKAYK